ncbi:sel1 repeat family protein [Chromobacterium violaceum]|uniref:SEL1-like repeat protein n=1 Tax=Chromobacterium violaceum TaxID=536 RepID=UPI0009B93C56|nr:sel1 repeat family protein [Chromobacterium violaceum]
MKVWCARGAILLALLLVGCHPAARPPAVRQVDRSMPDLNNVEAQLAFTCANEKDHLPKLDPQADMLYRYARWLRKNQIEKEDPRRYPEMERYYRIATAYGHYKANLDLREMIRNGQAHSENPSSEVIDLTQALIKEGIPGGYYDMGLYLQKGYGVQQDSELGLKYMRKAADLGNPEAQYAVGDMLTKINNPTVYEIGYDLWKCAAAQGHGQAALFYAITEEELKNYPEAIKYFHLAAKAGDESGASRLADGFNGPAKDDQLYYLGLAKDEERSQRYKAIWSILSDYSYAHPKVPELDDIVPLPPAKLPPWDGKLKWLEEFEANVPPEKPSEELITQLAKAKNLDPKTGRAISVSHS